MKKKLLVYVFFIILFLGLFTFSINFIISVQIKKSDYLNQYFKKEIEKAIKKEDIKFEFLNYEYNIFTGLKINEIRLLDSQNQLLCQFENIIIQRKFNNFSIKEIKKIILKKPDCKISTKENFFEFFSYLMEVLLEKEIELQIEEMTQVLEFSSLNKVYANFSPILKEKRIRITGNGIQNHNKVLKFYGYWYLNRELKNTIHFEFKEFMIQEEKFFKKILNSKFDKIIPDLKIEFITYGKGSIDITKEGYAFHFYTNLKDLKVISNFLNFYQPTGKIKYLRVKSWNHTQFKEEVQIIAEQILFSIQKMQEGNKDFFEFKISLNLDNQFLKTNWNSKGKIDLAGNFIDSSKEIYLNLNGEINNLLLLQKLYYPVIYIEYGKINSIKNNFIDFFTKGKFNSQDFNFSGNFQINSDRIPVWNIKTKFVLNSTDYQNLFKTTLELFKYLKSEALKENAIQFTDLGPAWENKFQKSELYSLYLKNIFFVTDIELKNPKQDLPELLGSLQSSENGFFIDLKSSPYLEEKKIQISYKIDYLSIVPLHNFSVNINLNSLDINLPFFCNQCEKFIKKFYFNYSSISNGLYIADLYLNNTSNFYLEIQNINLENESKRELLERFLEKDWKKDFFNLKIKFNTQGANYLPIEIELENENIQLKGYGNYNLFTEGKLTFYFFDKKNQLHRNFNIKIRKDGTWIPLYFF